MVFACLRGGVQDALSGVKHEQLHVRGYLEVLPGNRDVFFINPENPSSGDHHIGDLAGLRTHHEVIDAAESLVLRAAHLGADQFVGPERGILPVTGCAAAICCCRQLCTSAVGIFPLCISAT